MPLPNRSNKNCRSRLNVEWLADRLTPAVGINSGALTIIGGPLTDYADVWETHQGYEPFVHVNLNGAVTNWSKALLPNGVRFDGKGGNDYLWNTANVVVQAKGGPGHDVIEGGPLADNLSGGSGNDTLVGKEGTDKLYGEDNDDVLDGGADVDHLYGGDGNDTLLGGDGNDVMDGSNDTDSLDGGNGGDQLIAGLGADTLLGGPGNDALDGGNDNDFLDGGTENDTLWGGLYDDTLKGGDGNDELWGADGEDNLYGEWGDDTLCGGTGDDGLTPGYGDDKAWGESGADRFLKLHDGHDPLGFPVDAGTEDFVDADRDDVTVNFKVGAWAWSHEDLEAVDGGLAVLHHNDITGNTKLLKMPDGHSLNFFRDVMVGDLPDEYEDVLTPEKVGGTNAGGGEIHLYNYGMKGNVTSLIVHEIGHNWQGSGNPYADDFKAVSSWTTDPPDENYILSPGGVWWYDGNLSLIGEEPGFVSTYAQTNPYEDFAETFTYYFLNNSDHSNEYIDAKLFTITELLLSLS
jgi:Ca2+-binding RTX toxin-like protein